MDCGVIFFVFREFDEECVGVFCCFGGDFFLDKFFYGDVGVEVVLFFVLCCVFDVFFFCECELCCCGGNVVFG